ncbi:unnamed protein product [Arabidopsis lyrata]|uniref:Prolamin-like domain-containing protein n=1 Tax=Arabidopsis lyrata subsp. lyrata TaxID=81972 RepID=D7LBY0_ARALL|nr:uncharacterized protein LOC9314637 [Arabidopsis lyrata subsp. lyrata]EFH56654.1 hypothetical protein ARALYDRAFT_900601 [Arabidopsis lyrata subsp. lyrata]CAH8263021.1 unnamed protein product [Arabidopsis lyrata]|eukprot:XP_002880395.1 uncharacterized protein LOC9314637 [Arabidopsis lyrata subsp. lyrata]
METKTIFMIYSLIMVLLSFSHPTLAIEGDNDEPLLISDDEFDGMIAMSPTSDDYNENVGRKYSKKQIDYLKNCSKKMDVPYQCTVEVLADIIQNKSVSRDCCRGIVRAGKECHTEWMRLFFQIYQLKRFSSKRFSKTNEIWNRCSTEIGAVSPFSR